LDRKLRYMNPFSHEFFMKEALKEANKALEQNEIPVGAIIVCKNQIIARAHNLTETLNDATAHAEMLAFTSATNYLGGKHLNNCTLYVTLEPCIMCAGASYWTQLSEIVFGASDKKRGYKIINQKIIHPKTNVISGVLEDDCSKLLINFFKEKR